ncbi:MAG: 4Fe-4S dicluster domain-containing protein [Planctomycetes bacterium]|nr:4Fe-4S dicluster domain-containing protein [Planctomycetota bacterium]
MRISLGEAARGLAVLLEALSGPVVAAARAGTSPILGLAEARPRVLRPPGAVPESQFGQACTRCDACIRACPHGVVRKAGPEFGPDLFETPVVVPRENPCRMCADVPCIRSCKAGALARPNPGPVKIGTAIVGVEKCYLARGQPCDYCLKHCPVRPRAIRAGPPGRPPAVDASACTGCGVCVQICPAEAIEVEPNR